MTQYRLNETLLFDDETFQITRLSSARAPVKLSATAARCLKILIEHQGETVDKDRLIHEGWGKFGMMVTEGSMWKNISQLRQGFQKLQVPFEVIITVPRLGYTFSSQMSVERVPAPSFTLPVASPTLTLPEKESNEVEETASSEHPISNPLPESLQRKHNELKVIIFIASIVLVNLLASIGYEIWTRQGSALSSFDAASQYQRIDPLGESQIFVQTPFNQQTSYVQDALARLAQEKPLTILRNVPKFIYINKVSSHGVSSYFLCEAAITERNNGCKSYFSLHGEAK